MTAPNCLYLVALFFAVMGWAALAQAESDVTVVPTQSETTPAPAQNTVSPDGTPVVHKSLHKKKETATAAAQPNAVPPATTTTKSTPASNSARPPVTATPAANPAAVRPTVETGLPVARYPGMGSPIQGVSTYIPPTPVTLTPARSAAGASSTSSRLPYYASSLPSSVVPFTSSAAASYSSPSRATTSTPDIVFTNFSKKKKNFYPWKTGIITTMFWIGEGSTPISSTTNVQSSWDEDWLSNNHGSDNPNNRSGYAAGGHASTLNPFYVALPFNDLAFPDKAREWLPRGWHRPPVDGKQVSACKDRWVWIKNSNGQSCFAQWEDVGPLRYDHAEYVFGDERPTGMGDDHAGLDVSPAVAQYLGIDGKNRITSWRFVDAEDVPPGAWLALDEQAVLFSALHSMKLNSSPADLPIQRATEPIDDPSNIDSNKKKVDASRG